MGTWRPTNKHWTNASREELKEDWRLWEYVTDIKQKGRFGNRISLKVLGWCQTGSRAVTYILVSRDQMTRAYVQRTGVLRMRGDTCIVFCPLFSQCAPLIAKHDRSCHREIIVFRTSFSNHGLSYYKMGPVRQT